MDRIQLQAIKEVKGSIVLPPSKSYAQRAIALAALAQNNVTIQNIGSSDDVNAAIQVIEDLGAQFFQEGNDLIVFRDMEKDTTDDIVVNVGESGLGARLFSAFSLLFPQNFTVKGEGSITTRSMEMVVEGLSTFSKEVKSEDNCLPLQISGTAKGGKIVLDGSLSSQFITGILIVAPFLPFETEIVIENLKSKPYVDMTIDLLRKFGIEFRQVSVENIAFEGNQEVYRPVEYTVEGDWSAAAFWMVAASISGELELKGLKKFSKQADRRMMSIADRAGVKMEWEKEDVTIVRSELKPFSIDLTHSPDLFPPLAVLAAFTDGVSKVSGVHRLIHKESNRALTLQEEFAKAGVVIELEDDEMIIHGGTIKVEKNTVFNAHQDHRIAMAMSLFSLASEHTITIDGASAVNKSYPTFFEDLLSVSK